MLKIAKRAQKYRNSSNNKKDMKELKATHKTPTQNLSKTNAVALGAKADNKAKIRAHVAVRRMTFLLPHVSAGGKNMSPLHNYRYTSMKRVYLMLITSHKPPKV